MSDEGLFEDLPDHLRPKRGKASGAPRLREPARDQIELAAVDLESLIALDHPVRAIWSYVEQLDLSVLEDAVRARRHGPGRAPASPRLLLALWLYATIEGIGSARALARLCRSHDTYRWLCGGVSVNYHGLSDFRHGHPALLERLLTENVAALSAVGLVDLNEVVQDGVRIRACAGSASFRRRKTLKRELRKARCLVERLHRELEDDPDASNQRMRSARERAAREREQRVRAALGKQAEIEAQRERRKKTNKKQVSEQKEPRSSTTDPQARVMKMADGGFRPAYNGQFVNAGGGEVIIDVATTDNGSDRGLVRPALERLKRRYGFMPPRYLVDGGFHKNEDIEWAARQGVDIYGPPAQNKHASDPYAPRPDDGPGVAAWRRRMKSPHGKSVYRRRAQGELPNARLRQGAYRQFTVRGLEKVTCVLHLFALANNILAGHRLQAAA